MRSFILICLSCLVPFLVHAQSGDYEITAINPDLSTFTGESGQRVFTFRTRAGTGITVNGLEAKFFELKVGMKAKVTSADPGVATQITAFAVRIRAVAPNQTTLAEIDSQSSHELTASIPANSADGYSISGLRKGSRISLQYVRGKWKSWGHLATANPDDANCEGGELCRVAIALPSQSEKPGEVLAVVPPDTLKQPFVFEVEVDSPRLVLRINKKDGDFAKNPGTVEYVVKKIP